MEAAQNTESLESGLIHSHRPTQQAQAPLYVHTLLSKVKKFPVVLLYDWIDRLPCLPLLMPPAAPVSVFLSIFAVMNPRPAPTSLPPSNLCSHVACGDYLILYKIYPPIGRKKKGSSSDADSMNALAPTFFLLFLAPLSFFLRSWWSFPPFGDFSSPFSISFHATESVVFGPGEMVGTDGGVWGMVGEMCVMCVCDVYRMVWE